MRYPISTRHILLYSHRCLFLPGAIQCNSEFRIYFLKYQAKNLSINAYLIILKASTMTEKKYLKSLNWFRGIAIIFVFLSHVPKGEINGITANFLHSFFGNGTFYFVFISGYLFWHLKDRFEYIGYIKNKIKNVILPYLFVLTPVLILYGILEVNLDTPNEVLFSSTDFSTLLRLAKRRFFSKRVS